VVLTARTSVLKSITNQSNTAEVAGNTEVASVALLLRERVVVVLA